jgi:hypothetical protein
MPTKPKKGPLVLAGAGCLLSALSLLILLTSLALPSLTNGRTSWEEAMAGIVPGGACCGLSGLILFGGIGWMLASRRQGPKGAPPSGP